ncbi:MAG: tetratricopeptide repeat protein [Akkermansiaceae bacterium]|nr:tetratricopeptide repeat protein [Akkermansiaceae bacterium]MCP5544455.1 tetratricopeptide repeat protein [Akkermansiaceae bacterium]MCP5548363.1 tetratricopeptide repeat protein [Akkermansiaceae bacterium]
MKRDADAKSRVLPGSVFAVACWALGLMAFSQLLVAGMALATRFEESKVVRVIEKEVPKPIVIRVPQEPAVVAQAAPAPAPPPLRVVSPEPANLPEPTPMRMPLVADPRSERMVREAREARVAGDMMKAIVKLEEALKRSPDDATVHYELGLVHEEMGVFDTAAAHYEAVFRMGTDAGALYEMAGSKLRDGFEQPDAMLGKMALGRVRIFPPPGSGDGKNVTLTIPVQKAPGEEIDVNQVSVAVLFFNRTNKGEIIQLEPDCESWARMRWLKEPVDWTSGEENLRVTYNIPAQDSQTEHLFGGRSYYGQVVMLHYGDQVLDVQAWPRDLAARIPKTQSAPTENLLPEFQDTLPLDFDPDIPILPPLPEQ